MADTKIELPKKWYTIEELSERWVCKKDEIQHLIETKMLAAYRRYEFEHLDDLDGFNNRISRANNFLSTLPTVNLSVKIESDTTQDYLIVIPAEVARFELEQGICINADQEESDAQFCERLKQKGLTDTKIAHELKKAYPRITAHRIGKLITAKPDTFVTADAYRKRGERFFEK